MKKIILLTTVLFSVTLLRAQFMANETIIYTTADLPFYVSINGHKMNGEPQTSVTLKDIYTPSLEVRISFVDSTIMPFTQTIELVGREGTIPKPYQSAYKIEKKRKKYLLVLDYMKATSIEPAPYNPNKK